MNPHYLKGDLKSPLNSASKGYINVADEMPPVAELDLKVPLQIVGLASSDKYLRESKEKSGRDKKKDKSKKKNKKKHKKKEESDEEEDEEEPIQHVVNTVIEMPEGATMSDNEESALDANDPHRALDIDLDM